MRLLRLGRHITGCAAVSWRRFATPVGLLILLVALVALAGCMRVERTFTINGDGSGVYVLTVGFRQPTPGDPNSVPTNDITAMEGFGAHVQTQGGSYRRYDDQGYTFWSFTRPFTSISQAEAQLQEDPRQDDSTHFPLLYQDSLHVATDSGLFRPAAFHVTGKISLVDPTGKAQKDWKDATESVTITMANGVSAHQGGVQDGNSVTYKIAYNESATLDVSGNASQGSSGTGCTGSAALAVAALGFVLLRRAARDVTR